jgi:hypothetical protein
MLATAVSVEIIDDPTDRKDAAERVIDSAERIVRDVNDGLGKRAGGTTQPPLH